MRHALLAIALAIPSTTGCGRAWYDHSPSGPSDASIDARVIDGTDAGDTPSDAGPGIDAGTSFDAGLRGDAAIELCSPDPAAPTCETVIDCGGSGSCVDGRCYAGDDGDVCTSNGGCRSLACIAGCCSSGALGAPCDSDGNCDSLHCFDGRCEGHGIGAGCNASSDCDSFNCQDRRCEGRGPGSRCDGNADCDSFSCVDAICT